MKSEERHEIETNELAKLLSGSGGKVGPYVSYIIYGVLAIAAVWAIARLTTGNMQTKKLQAWDSYTLATLPGRSDTDGLKTAATQYSGQMIGELAQIAYADSQLSAGCQNFFLNKQVASEQLDTALAEYEKLAKSADDKNLRDRAQLGVAKTLEAQGKIDEAVVAYEKVTGPFSEIADARAKELGDVGADQYGDWLAKAEGARRMSGFGGDSRPNFSADALDLPNVTPSTGTDVVGEQDFLELLDQYKRTAPDQPTEEAATTEGDEMTADIVGDAAEESTDEPADGAESTSDDPSED